MKRTSEMTAMERITQTLQNAEAQNIYDQLRAHLLDIQPSVSATLLAAEYLLAECILRYHEAANNYKPGSEDLQQVTLAICENIKRTVEANKK